MFLIETILFKAGSIGTETDGCLSREIYCRIHSLH
jgi:hypothetical protein